MEPLTLGVLSPRPLVSILVANYNYGRYLPQAVDSVLAQTYPHFELLICDDGSTDDSAAVIAAQTERDPRVRAFSKPNGGQASAWNYAYKHSGGAIISLLDSDDAFLPEKLERVVATFQEHPDAGLVYHRYRVAEQDLRPTDETRPAELYAGYLRDDAVQQGGYAFESKTSDISLRREFAERIFPLPETLNGYGDGYIGRLAAFLTEVVPIPDALSLYRIHGSNLLGHSAVFDEVAMDRMIGSVLTVFEHQRLFMEREFGPEPAGRLRVTDVAFARELLAALYLLRGKPPEGVRGFTRDDILASFGQSRRRTVWSLLYSMPRPLAVALLRAWWSNGAWKQAARPVARLLRIARPKS